MKIISFFHENNSRREHFMGPYVRLHFLILCSFPFERMAFICLRFSLFVVCLVPFLSCWMAQFAAICLLIQYE